MRRVNLIISLMAITLAACTSDDLPIEDSTNSTISNPVYRLVSEYYASVGNGTRSDNGGITLTNVSRQTYQVVGDTVIRAEDLTRANGQPADNQFDMVTAEFSVGSQKGYAILSDDERLDRVYFFTDNGSICDSSYIVPLKEFIDCLPQYVGLTIDSVRTIETTRATNVNISNVVPFKWDQCYPFNMYAPECNEGICASSEYRGRMPIGCVTTATAQAIATIGTFYGVFYGTGDIDFSALPKYSSQMSSTEQKQIGSFFHEVALCCQIRFGCGASSGYTKAAYQYLKDLRFDCSYSDSSIDATKVIDELKQGIPHIVGGTGDDGGHMWLIDGIRSNGDYYDFHCNWGWGGSSDCWSIGNPYSFGTVPMFPNNPTHIYIKSKRII